MERHFAAQQTEDFIVQRVRHENAPKIDLESTMNLHSNHALFQLLLFFAIHQGHMACLPPAATYIPRAWWCYRAKICGDCFQRFTASFWHLLRFFVSNQGRNAEHVLSDTLSYSFGNCWVRNQLWSACLFIIWPLRKANVCPFSPKTAKIDPRLHLRYTDQLKEPVKVLCRRTSHYSLLFISKSQFRPIRSPIVSGFKTHLAILAITTSEEFGQICNNIREAS